MRPLAGTKLSMHVLVVVQRAQSANIRRLSGFATREKTQQRP